LNITRLCQKEQGAAVYGYNNHSDNGVDSQWWQRRGQATVAKAEAVQGQTTINQKAVVIAAEMQRRCRQPCQWQREWRRWQCWQQRSSQGSGDGGANMAPSVAEGTADGRCGRGSSFVLLIFA
jgi:hypothetical protein